MNKKDLINGTIVETREGNRYLVLDNNLLNLSTLDSWNDLHYFNDNLKNKDYKDFDIVKVSIPNNKNDIHNVFSSNANKNKSGVWSWIRPDKPKLTEDEKAILRNLPKEYKYTARDENEELYIYCTKPEKNKVLEHWYGGCDYEEFDLFKHLFQFIKWEDEEPYLIEDLLKD